MTLARRIVPIDTGLDIGWTEANGCPLITITDSVVMRLIDTFFPWPLRPLFLHQELSPFLPSIKRTLDPAIPSKFLHSSIPNTLSTLPVSLHSFSSRSISSFTLPDHSLTSIRPRITENHSGPVSHASDQTETESQSSTQLRERSGSQSSTASRTQLGESFSTLPSGFLYLGHDAPRVSSPRV
ncbi:hypothetical protein P175DRAFT_0530072 [Aspergillus ochraceoroseus IBT 24754]|uniref:Uncharacterized protein n=1 Tax=Aspergillus ochraceoroseus IBT 24754 TaxID=1392256 RepID=A0A2T5M383_9EURO|nr:uncharacterized protein P175DRAFT_0530072 [Aspergillus ochraceoroseus IBT 24754]PTU22982.1 hypothetical protein P175DRAFT_0530072 [Aspergillus ochraceoroseus IBT 24754]